MSRPGTLLPHDAWNQKLVESVHPPGWRNPEPASRYDLVVLGAGTAGLVSAAVSAGLGARVAPRFQLFIVATLLSHSLTDNRLITAQCGTASNCESATC